MPSPSSAHPPQLRKPGVPLLVRLRKVLLLAVLLVVAAVFGLYYFGRAGLDQLREPPPVADENLLGQGQEVTTTSQGFDYTQYDEGRELFRLRGATYQEDRSDEVHLQSVDLLIYRPDGSQFHVLGEEALYNRKDNAAEISGDVRVTGPQQLKLHSERLEVGQQGQRINSPQPVTFEYGGRLGGDAQQMRVDLPTNLYLLQGNVKLHSLPGTSPLPVNLDANRAFLEELRGLLRAEGKVRVTYGSDWMEAQRVSLYLTEERSTARFMRARWEVKGEINSAILRQDGAAAAGQPSPTFVYAAETLSAVFNPETGELRKLELEGSPRQAAHLLSTDAATGNTRTVVANYLMGDFGDTGEFQLVQAYGQVWIVEQEAGAKPGRYLREARGERARGQMDPGGALRRVTLVGSVDYREAAVRIRSQRAELDLGTQVAEFTGNPVQVTSDRGELSAPRVSYRQAEDLLLASKGVRATLRQLPKEGGGLPGPLMSSGEGPVWVESEDAYFRRAEGSYVFRGKVRAWRGENLLLAEEMRVREPGRELMAAGGVKTVWYPPAEPAPEPDQLKQPAQAKKAPPAPVQGAIEVTAGSFAYLGAEQRLRYVGDVVVLDGERTLRCGEADLLLDDQQQLRQLNCSAGAHLEDRVSGRVVTGSLAIYDVAAQTVDITGNPATMKDKAGSQMQGQRALYNIRTGLLEFRSLPAVESAQPSGTSPAGKDPAPAPPAGGGGANPTRS